jgi:hypothetical protein
MENENSKSNKGMPNGWGWEHSKSFFEQKKNLATLGPAVYRHIMCT